jgi:cytochrome P450
VEATEILQALFTSDAASDPYPHYADLLAAGEVFHPSRWSSVFVVGHAAIESVLRDPVFEVQGATGLDESFPAWREHPSMSKNSVLDLNGGEHARVRGLMSRAFSHRRVASLAPVIAATTASLLDDMADRGSGGEPVDFVAHFACLLPVIVICDLIGIPQSDRETFRPLAELRRRSALLPRRGPGPAGSDDRVPGAARAIPRHCRGRRGPPGTGTGLPGVREPAGPC